MSTQLYLAFSANTWACDSISENDWTANPIGLLVSFYYMNQFKTKAMPRIGDKPIRRMLDSGAFSAWKSKKSIDIDALITESKNPYWQETVGLDVIGDGAGSHANALYMRDRGSPAMPVFHIGDPWQLLEDYCAEFPKVGLSCRFGENEKESLKFYDGCFARVWPHKYHSFGWVKESMLLSYPFHSADTASWAVNPCAWGGWKTYGRLRARGVVDLRVEIRAYTQMQGRIQHRWQNTFQQVGWAAPTHSITTPETMPAAALSPN